MKQMRRRWGSKGEKQTEGLWERECCGERVNMLVCQHSINSWPVNNLFDSETVSTMHKEQKMQCYTRLFRVLTLYGQRRLLQVRTNQSILSNLMTLTNIGCKNPRDIQDFGKWHKGLYWDILLLFKLLQLDSMWLPNQIILPA